MRATKVDQYMSRLKPTWRPVAEALRTLVQTSAPDGVVESIKWGMPVFSLDGTNVCYIDSRTATHVNLGFYHGTHLADPVRLLEGTGKTLRHVKIRTPEEAASPALGELVRAAFLHERE